VIVNPDMEGRPKQTALSGAAAKAAAAAGVKPAALVSRVGPHDKPLPKPAFELSPKTLDPKTAIAKKAAPRAKTHKKAAAKAKPVPSKKTVASSASPKTGAASQSPVQKAEARKPASTPKGQAPMPKPSPAIARQQVANTN